MILLLWGIYVGVGPGAGPTDVLDTPPVPVGTIPKCTTVRHTSPVILHTNILLDKE